MFKFLDKHSNKPLIASFHSWMEQRLKAEPYELHEGPAAWYRPHRDSELVVYPQPRTVAENPQFKVRSDLLTDPSGLFYMRGGMIEGSEGSILSPEGELFSEFTYVNYARQWERHPFFKRQRHPEAQELKGSYATLTYPESRNYFHWLIESLPRLTLLKPVLEVLDGIFIPSGLLPAARESLIRAGVKESQLIELTDDTRFRCQRLWVPVYCAGCNVPQWAHQSLKSLYSIVETQPTKRIYLSRGDAGKRRVINENKVESLLSQHGFETIQTGELSFGEQVALFSQAAYVVAPHGAGIANVLFAPSQCKVLELLPTDEIPPNVYYPLVASVGCEYWYLNGVSGNGQGIHADFEVPESILEKTLKAMLDLS